MQGEPSSAILAQQSGEGQTRARLTVSRHALPVVAVVGAWLLMMALIGIGGNFPLNDDFWFHWTARHLAEEGKLRILPGVAQLLVWHAAWGAALIHVFGPSHVVLRCGMLAWGLTGLLTLYALGRRLGWGVSRSLALVFLVGASPWYLNLAFSYMTDLPQVVLLLLAIFTLITADRGQPWRLMLCGSCVALASLTRQTALLTVPAFLLLVVTDARNAQTADWKPRALRNALLLAVPALVIYGLGHSWYTHVNGTTSEYENRWSALRKVNYHPLFHLLAAWHYVGLWIFPIAVAAWFRARESLRQLLPRRTVLIALTGLLAYSIAAPIAWWVDTPGHWGLEIHYSPLMPYLPNLFYRLGVGAPTFYDIYHGKVPLLHGSHWFGVPLTLLSTLGGIAAFGLIGVAARRAYAFARSRVASASCDLTNWDVNYMSRDRERARLLLLGVAVCYFCGLCLVKYIFDRYLFPLMPLLVALAIDGCPERVTRSKAGIAALALYVVFSVGAMHEYMDWNAARALSVQKLKARGITDDDIDGGYEVNGVSRLIPHAVQLGKVFPVRKHDPFCGLDARYRLAFAPSHSSECITIDEQLFWSWPGTGKHAIYTLDCGAQSARAQSALTPMQSGN